MLNQQLDRKVLKQYFDDVERWTSEDHELGMSCAEKMLFHLQRQTHYAQRHMERILFISLVEE
jgi:hypothetical protein